MLLAIFFIIGTGISRGSLNYIIVNAIPNIGLCSVIANRPSLDPLRGGDLLSPQHSP